MSPSPFCDLYLIEIQYLIFEVWIKFFYSDVKLIHTTHRILKIGDKQQTRQTWVFAKEGQIHEIGFTLLSWETIQISKKVYPL